MAYFLGRDVNVFLTTETGVTDKAIGATGSASSSATLIAGAPGGIVNLFADDMNSGKVITGYTAQADITGIEVSLGTMDEDTSYIGQTQPGKVEIKKEYTVSLTRKKKNNLWDIIFNGDGTNNARFGLGNGTSGFGTGKVNPKSIVDSGVTTASCYGYRIHLQYKTGSAGSQANEEMICLTNCCITGYTTTLNADGVQEETLEFSSYQPARYPEQADEIYITLTPTDGF